MKVRLFVWLALGLIMAACRSKIAGDATQPATLVHLPVVIREGYGPFYPGFGIIGNDQVDNPNWGKIYLPVKGRPTHWSSVNRKMVWLSGHQLAYQNYQMGNISPDFYRTLQKNWRWTPDSTKLSAKPIKCYVYVITGYDERRNHWAAMVDTNNNLDFSDETAFYPELINTATVPDRISDVQQIQYEAYQNGKIVSVQAPMLIKRLGDQFMYNIPQYGVTTLKQGDKAYELMVSSGFDRTDFEKTDVILATSVSGSGRVNKDDLVPIGEYIEVGGTRYKNNGLDPFFNWLELEPVNAAASAYALKVGAPFRPFVTNEFTTGQTISLEKLKGKFVFIDFWGTWCGPCRAAMPALKEVYAKTNRKEIEFIGIVGNNTPAELKAYLDKQNIGWPQILSDQSNKLIELNHITAYPTTVLLNPEGVIVAKNIKAEELHRFLKETAR